MFTSFLFAQGSVPSGLDWLWSFGTTALVVMGLLAAAAAFVRLCPMVLSLIHLDFLNLCG